MAGDEVREKVKKKNATKEEKGRWVETKRTERNREIKCKND